MVFHSKMDAYYVKLMITVIIVVGLVTLFPIFIEGAPLSAILILTSIFIIFTTLFLWLNLSVKYIFYENYLLIKSGPFKSKIPYESITKITETHAILTGHGILTSRDALEIYNKTTFYGSIKISPEYKSEFIKELKNRGPHIQLEE